MNDVVGGRPLVVTWCPLCASALVFDRRVAGKTLTFDVSGFLYQQTKCSTTPRHTAFGASSPTARSPGRCAAIGSSSCPRRSNRGASGVPRIRARACSRFAGTSSHRVSSSLRPTSMPAVKRAPTTRTPATCRRSRCTTAASSTGWRERHASSRFSWWAEQGVPVSVARPPHGRRRHVRRCSSHRLLERLSLRAAGLLASTRRTRAALPPRRGRDPRHCHRLALVRFDWNCRRGNARREQTPTAPVHVSLLVRVALLPPANDHRSLLEQNLHRKLGRAPTCDEIRRAIEVDVGP